MNNFKVIGVYYGESNNDNNNFIFGIDIIYIIIELYIIIFNNSDSSLLKKFGKAAAITGGVIAGISLFPIILGFGTTGIVAGSVAAGIQAAIGNVTAGSLFAVSTSLGMTGAFASTSVAGTALGLGGLAAYLNSSFNPENDAIIIKITIIIIIIVVNNHNLINELGNIIIKLLENRTPSEREKIRIEYNKKIEDQNRDFDNDIINYIRDNNSKSHVENLLKKTKDINVKTEYVRRLMNNISFEDYLEKKFLSSDSLLTSFFKKPESWTQIISSKFTYSKNDESLIEAVISEKDDPLIIIRLLEHKTEEQRKVIFDTNLEDITEEEKMKKRILLTSIKSYMPDYEKNFVEFLLDKVLRENNIN